MHSYVKELEGIYSSNGLFTAQQVFVSSVRDVLIKAASEYEVKFGGNPIFTTLKILGGVQCGRPQSAHSHARQRSFGRSEISFHRRCRGA